MTRDQALPYVAHCLDDALNVRTVSEMPDNARLVVWQCGFEPVAVAVWSYLGVRLDADEAAEIASDYLTEIGWHAGDGPDEPDFIL